MNTHAKPQAKSFTLLWSEPDPRFLRSLLPPAPTLPLNDVLGPRLASWVERSAECKGAPADYVFSCLLTAAGAAIGNSRWVEVWSGWKEPAVIWTMCIGQPSAGKSPAIVAVLEPYRKAERPLREASEKQWADWKHRVDLAKLTESVWKEAFKKALNARDMPPEKPNGCDAGPEPHIRRLVVSDGTIEKLGILLAAHPRDQILLKRDELAGWLEGMRRYAGGGSDRPFWLEAFGGGDFPVERVGRPAITIDRLTIGVLGGIQPDRLKSLLFDSDDDGLLARFIPIWPEPAPLQRPRASADDGLIERVFNTLLRLEPATDAKDRMEPRLIPFTEEARALMDQFREKVRAWESGSEGLMTSFIGKLHGFAARIAMILAFLDWASSDAHEEEDNIPGNFLPKLPEAIRSPKAPENISAADFNRASHLVEAYILPMARRAYADASTPKVERAARRLVAIIRERRWSTFSSRQVLRLECAEWKDAAELKPVLSMLEEGDCIRAVPQEANPAGGRPQRLFTVNPAIHRG